MNNGVMLNAYPDSIGGNLSRMISFLDRLDVKGAFSDFYILPSLFNTDLDRGFSVRDYGINQTFATSENLADIKALGLSLKLDFILNHASVLSPQFQDILINGEKSIYTDFFINWNKFWEGYGEMTPSGYVQPEEKYLKDMFFRKPGLPLIMVKMPDGKSVPYWNTFYSQENESAIDSKNRYLGQMDLNIKSPLVWEFYEDTIYRLAGYGARIIRLDAFAYVPKEPGKRNFLNEPETWELLKKVEVIADKLDVQLLPEIHSSYAEKTYLTLAKKGYLIYDFFLPGLIIDAIEQGDSEFLYRWAMEVKTLGIQTVNMLGCHDGIPLLDLKGLVPDEQIQTLIDTVTSRGGYVKNLHGQKNIYYQVNATYYSALGEDNRKMLLARAIQLFMPGKPQVWYLDLFVGKNDYDAVVRAGDGGHKEINRTNFTDEQIEQGLEKEVVKKQLELLRMRNTFPAFDPEGEMTINRPTRSQIEITWRKNGCIARLFANLSNLSFVVAATNSNTQTVFYMEEGDISK